MTGCGSNRLGPLFPFLGEGSPTKIDYRKKGTLILTSLLEDLAQQASSCVSSHVFNLRSQHRQGETQSRIEIESC